MKHLATIHTILFGDLRPWLPTAARRLESYRLGEEPAEHSYPTIGGGARQAAAEAGRTAGILPSRRPDGLDGNSSGIGTKPTTPRFYVTARLRRPYSRLTYRYYQLIQQESHHYWHMLVRSLHSLTSAQRHHKLSGSLHYLLWLLEQVEPPLQQHRARDSQYVLRLIAVVCMQLVMDLNLRQPKANRVPHYNALYLFTAVLNQPLRGSSPFRHSPAWWKRRLNTVLSSQRLDHDFRRCWLELRYNGRQTNMEEAARLCLWEWMHHLENAALLIALEAPFLNHRPVMLTDARFCRQWVQGLWDDCMNDAKPTGCGQTLRNISEAADCVEELLPGIGTSLPEEGWLSEAAELIRLIDEVRRTVSLRNLTSTIHNSKNVNVLPAGEQKFERSFRQRFISVDEFAAAIGASDRTVRRYLEGSDIRVLEFSSNIRFLYRADVERYLNKITK